MRGRHAEGGRGGGQVVVAGDHDGLVVGDALESGQVPRVVAAERVILGQVAGPADQRVVDLDRVELAVQVVELLHDGGVGRV